MANVAAILLAAGNASRMGAPKQLLDYGGRPLLRHAAETALASGCSKVIVVLGAKAGAVAPALDGLPVVTVVNPRWDEGMGTSIQAGLRAAAAASAEAVILMLADQPLISAGFLDRLIGIHTDAGQAIVAARYAGTAGVPALFARQYFDDLEALRPAQGCKAVIQANEGNACLVDCPEAEFDVDTPDDYQRLQTLAGAK
ncbi:nucleotidyltransferase family protein [Paludibaculum fermentans]|uniref:Nucleotidyltransferase family protein n=1 Tax=Paludibaculum fermentans TaxID=1473598 RepID=A0A7S7NUN1_PALFE|nr:nucleotidyltransferase family protein [Paludibaculum fermentans]QOY90140.1 nucleotidyltransferase family protein [Paludibaculum fermentans]